MNILLDRLPYSIVYEGKRHRLFPYFNRILWLLKIQAEQNLFDDDKLEVACRLIVEGTPSAGLYEAAVNAIVGEQAEQDNDAPPVFDFIQDAELIYTAFRQSYGIDLRTEHDHMHWQEFVTLFNGLPEGTRFAQIVEIRTRPMPKPSKENAEYRITLAQLKAKYAIKEDPDKVRARFARQMMALADKMTNKAGDNT